MAGGGTTIVVVTFLLRGARLIRSKENVLRIRVTGNESRPVVACNTRNVSQNSTSLSLNKNCDHKLRHPHLLLHITTRMENSTDKDCPRSRGRSDGPSDNPEWEE